ncbi:MAG: hypothetical protein Q7J11_01700 [Candidatus Roizmanbacteria bacterium]|nr:hypothetical protein [Candidatus Roizmanbacteria bacterium]
MNRPILKQKVRELRKRGKTYSEINQELKTTIPKNTLSYWCREIILPSWYSEKIKNLNKESLKKARVTGLNINKEKRRKYLSLLLKKNSDSIKKINVSTQKLLLSILYLGEGAKYISAPCLTLGNSNPLIIKFYLKLLKNCYTIDKLKFRGRIQCRFDQDIKVLENFWVSITGIEKKQFYPTYVDKRTIGKPTLKKNYKGVCTIHYFDARIQIELELLAKLIMDKVVPGPIV